MSGIVDDNIVEGNETVSVTLTSVSGDPQITLDPTPADLAATVTIADNDSATVSITANDAAGQRDGHRQRPVHGQPDRKVSSTDTRGQLHRRRQRATPTTDYTALTGSVTILAGSLSATDRRERHRRRRIVEGNETVIVTLTSVSGDPQITLDPTTATWRPRSPSADNDSATVSITANDAAASETATDNGQFTVSLTPGQLHRRRLVNYTVGGSRHAGHRLHRADRQRDDPGRATSATHRRQRHRRRRIVEANETVSVTLTSVSGDPQITLDPTTANLAATVTIADNDARTVVDHGQRCVGQRDGDRQRPVHRSA